MCFKVLLHLNMCATEAGSCIELQDAQLDATLLLVLVLVLLLLLLLVNLYIIIQELHCIIQVMVVSKLKKPLVRGETSSRN